MYFVVNYYCSIVVLWLCKIDLLSMYLGSSFDVQLRQSAAACLVVALANHGDNQTHALGVDGLEEDLAFVGRLDWQYRDQNEALELMRMLDMNVSALTGVADEGKSRNEMLVLVPSKTNISFRTSNMEESAPPS